MRHLFLLIAAFTMLLGALPVPGAAGAQTGVLPCGAACQRVEAVEKADYVPGQVVVSFKEGAPGLRRGQIMASEQAKAVRRIPALDVVVMELPPGLSVAQGVARFERYSDVESAEPNHILSIAQVVDPELDDQWGLGKIDAPAAWAELASPTDPIIAIVDTGIDNTHPDLLPNLWINSDEIPDNGADDDGNGKVDDVWGWDFRNGDADPVDDHSHGTHVAGIAAATRDGSGIAGVCPHCRVMAVKVAGADGTAPLATVADGIVYAYQNGARVISLSLGAYVDGGSPVLESAVSDAWAAGSVVVAAAGNEALETAIYFPAASASAIGVASTGQTDIRSCYSNFGSDLVSVSAPGELIYSTVPGGEYAAYSGTSMATPHVSGLAGLLFSQDPARTNTTVRALIETTTRDLGLDGIDAVYGTGRIDAYRAVTGGVTGPASPGIAPLTTTSKSGSGYANARKLVREDDGTLHLVWHTKTGTSYQVLYATSGDDGGSWTGPQTVFASTAATYHPALALGGGYLYLAFPSLEGSAFYRTWFSRRELPGGGWETPAPLTADTYDAVRPDIYYDSTNGRLHLVASSYDSGTDPQQVVYYTASDNQGQDWRDILAVNPNQAGYEGNTRYAMVHAHGDNVWIAARIIDGSFLIYYYLTTVRSTDGGLTWFDQYKVSSYLALASAEYGISLAGVGDRVYMVYEVGGNLYFRQWLGSAWSDYLQLESSGKWPTITQAADGQAWMLWEDAGSLKLRHYNGLAWMDAELLHAATTLDKIYFPNLALGTGGGRVQWVQTRCTGSPFTLEVDGRDATYEHPSYLFYADAGGPGDDAYSVGRGFGWLDGEALTDWGTLPYQSARIDQADTELRYQFDGLDPAGHYRLHLTFYQASGAPVVQKLQIDGVDASASFEIGDGETYATVLRVPPAAYAADGSIIAGAVRMGCVSGGVLLNEIGLEEITPPPGPICNEVRATPQRTVAYGAVTIAGAAAPVGTVVQALNFAGDVVGCTVVQEVGQYGFMQIYGQDSPDIPGMQDGEIVDFRVDGGPAAQGPALHWQDDTATHQVDLASGSVEEQCSTLDAGWNLFSFWPEPAVPAGERVLASLEGSYCRVLGETGIYDCALDPQYITLTELLPGDSYYLRVLGGSAADLRVEGMVTPVDTPIPLAIGWNWIGYLPTTVLPIETALAAIDDQYDLVHGLDATYDPAQPTFSTLTHMEPGKGYLLHATEATDLVYPAGTGLAHELLPEEDPSVCGDVTPTPSFTLVYGKLLIGGDPAPPGTLVEVLTPRGEVAGCTMVHHQGDYGFVRVYGMDPVAPPIPGFREGEPLAFRVNGAAATAAPAVHWTNDLVPHEVDLKARRVWFPVYLPLAFRGD